MIFADTSFFVAAAARRDAHHASAVELLSRYGGAGLVTTNHVRGETWTFLNRRHGHRVASDFVRRLERTRLVETAHLGRDLEQAALRWLLRHDDREYSFVDATSFAFMKANRVREALSFDGDFTAAGFVELRP